MSLILDALKRAEHDRKSSQDGSVNTDLVTQNLQSTHHSPIKNPFYWRWLLLLITLIALLTWIFIHHHATEVNKIDTSVNSKKEVGMQKSAAPIAEPQINTPSNSPLAATHNHSIAAEPTDADRIVSRLYQSATSLPNLDDIQIAQLYVESSASHSIGEIETQSTPVSIEAQNPLPDLNADLPHNLRTTSEIRRLADTNATAFDELSFNQKQLFPSVNYSQHNYLGNSASSVVINGELMRVGSRITQDLTLEEIVEDGVIFNFYGKRVSFKALSSWINM